MLRICCWYALISLIILRLEYSQCENNLFDEGGAFISRSIVDTLPRYVLYDVNEPEGFNLRRDVFIRMASFIHHLNKVSDFHWVLVLPPWHRLYHWRSRDLMQDRLPWSLFFDVDSIKKITPVVELHEFFLMNGLRPLDVQVTLQNFYGVTDEMYSDFSDKWEIANCKSGVQKKFWGLNNLTFTNSICISFQGISTQLAGIIEELQPRTIIFDHAEISLHEYYAGRNYWTVRKSMQFSKSLHEIAIEYKSKNLKDKYMCSHLRRRDFVYGHPSDVPSIKGAAKQIIEKLSSLDKIKTIFVATDASKIEFQELRKYLELYRVMRFEADEKILNAYMDGGVAIIDQIICSHADYFIGTSKSTFTFRIQEEREIQGFAPETTFNGFCGDDATVVCTQPTKWRLLE